MQINNKYQIGDKVYAIRTKKLTMDCPVCLTDGAISYNNYEIKCPNCNGDGKLDTSRSVWVLVEEELMVHSIKAKIWKNGQSFKYTLFGQTEHIKNRSESHIFKTIKEAVGMCRALNEVKAKER